MVHLRASNGNAAALLAPIGQLASSRDIEGLRVTTAESSICVFRQCPANALLCGGETEAEAKSLLDQGLDLMQNYLASAILTSQ